MKENWRPILKTARNVLILTHVDPDGDALGSAYFLREILQKIKPKLKVNVLFDPKHKNELNLFIKKTDTERPALSAVDLIISVDASNISRLYGAKDHKIDICIDHHVSAEKFAKINIIDTRAASCTLVVYELLKELKLKLTKTMAEYLYLGLVSDTGNFAFANTDERALAAALDCVRLGVKPHVIYNKINEQLEYKEVVDFARALTKSERHCGGKLVLTGVPRKLRVDNRFLIDFIRRDKHAEVAVVLVDKKDHIKLSLRSKTDLDVAKIAARFNGGGHRKAAAGKIFNATLAEAKKQVVDYFSKNVF